MPRTIDDEALSKRMTLDVSAPDGSITGLPMKSIPHMEFPRVIYRHPKEPYRKIEYRNAQHEVVDVETVPADHQTKLVADDKELKAALKDGWVLKPYIPVPPPDPNAALYEGPAAN